MDTLVSRLTQLAGTTGFNQISWGHIVMLAVGVVLLLLAIKKGFEPLLLIPIGFGAIITNLPGSGIMDPDHGFL